ncbi:MAG: choice-of-anchor Q domain-containing protein, partial [Candidatus Omnitrophota bacterium]
MKRTLVKFVNGFAVLCALALFAGWAEAVTYHVNNTDPSASDSNPGTAALPWLTIQKAANTVVAGDIVIVNPGDYNERISFTQGHSGNAENKIIFRAEPRRSVTIQGFYTLFCNYLRIEGFNITNSNPGNIEGPGILIRSHNVEVVDNYIYEIKGNAAIGGYWGKPWFNNCYIAGNKIYRCQAGIHVQGDNWVVEHNEVERLYEWSTMDPAGGWHFLDCDYSRFFGNNIIISSNHFHGAVLSEVGASHVDGFQTFTRNGEYASNVTIEGNIIEGFFNQGAMIMDEGEGTGYVNNIVIKNNIFKDGVSWGICVMKNVKDVLVANNVFFNIETVVNGHPEGIGVGIREESSGRIYNNIFYSTVTAIGTDATCTVEEDNNLFYDIYSDFPDRAPHDIWNTDPQFLNPADNDFRLLSTSPAIDSGRTVDISTDFEGTSRPQGSRYDIGAYEFAIDDYTPYPILIANLDGDNLGDIVIDFGTDYGIWARYGTGTWALLSSASPEAMASGDIDGNGKDDIVIDFGSDYGIWILGDSGLWTRVSDVDPGSIVTGDLDGDNLGDIVIDFGADYGIWARYGTGTWALLSSATPEAMASGDIDGNGKDDIVIDFGPDYGIWILGDNGLWTRVSDVDPGSIVTGDLDGDNLVDIVIDFGTDYGIWARYGTGTWALLSSATPESMASGDIDG